MTGWKLGRADEVQETNSVGALPTRFLLCSATVHAPAGTHLQAALGEVNALAHDSVFTSYTSGDRHETLRKPPCGAVSDKTKCVLGGEVFHCALSDEGLNEPFQNTHPHTHARARTYSCTQYIVGGELMKRARCSKGPVVVEKLVRACQAYLGSTVSSEFQAKPERTMGLPGRR